MMGREPGEPYLVLCVAPERRLWTMMSDEDSTQVTSEDLRQEQPDKMPRCLNTDLKTDERQTRND